MHDASPSFFPRPIAQGCTSKNDNKESSGPGDQQCYYFLLNEYLDLETESKTGRLRIPDAPDLCWQLAQLHRRTRSPNGKFGFDVTSYNGIVPQYVEWQDSWEVFFSNSLRHLLDFIAQHDRAWPELESVAEPLFVQVIPHLLGRLTVKPVLLHGDLW